VVAADLLSFMSCIESKTIPRSILPSVQPEERMVRAIDTLCRYSFIVDRGNQDIYDTHKLVHLAIEKWTEENGNLTTTIEKAIKHVSAVFPTVEFENQAIYRDFLTNALRLLTEQESKDVKARYTLCLKIEQCLYEERRISEAVKWIKESCQ
jgi:hypothetical protein